MVTNKTKVFFDTVAYNYSQRYGTKDKRSIFFNNRLRFSLQNEYFKNKSVLDIGAGSGIIYHKLRNIAHKYTACDISEKIMIEGGIPKKNRRLIKNNLEDLVRGEKYDYIFMLGVTTYLSKKELQDYIKQIELCSHAGTRIIISYTLNNYIHIKWRSFITKLSNTIFKPFFKKKKLLVNSGIQMSLHNANECFNLSNNLNVYDFNYQNIFLPPFDRILPFKILFYIDKLINKLLGQKLIKFLASDITIKYTYQQRQKINVNNYF